LFHDVPLFTKVFSLYLTIDSRLCNRIFLQKTVENRFRTRGAEDLKCSERKRRAFSIVFMQKARRALLHGGLKGQ